MTRTTPPRPVALAALFPELAALARTTTRLHPRPGKPTPQESSVGGPLLWPVDDPWPFCMGPHSTWMGKVTTVADVRLAREMSAKAWGPPRIELTDEERTLAAELQYGRHSLSDRPIAMIPVAQLYARDIPDLHAPVGSDLLQVLWCPFDHDYPDGPMPKVKLVWRSSAKITDVLTEPPQPVAVQLYGEYVPEVCVVHPEQVFEYPAPLELDEDVRKQVREWGKHAKVWPEKMGGGINGTNVSCLSWGRNTIGSSCLWRQDGRLGVGDHGVSLTRGRRSAQAVAQR